MTEALRFVPPLPNQHAQIVAQSLSLRRALELAERFARTPLAILLTGPTGTGKELFARRIHAWSGREGPFVPVNCAALPEDMVESLLFGHARGAFTGAVSDRTGFIEAADRGTLYLDELTSLPREAQAKLLRVLESRDVYRLGETTPRRVDFRMVASGHDDLATQIRDGGFRLDLFTRVAGVRLELAPLRERREDVWPLAEHFAELEGWVLAPETAPILASYDWPGNARELRNAVERAGFLSSNPVIGAAVLAEAIELGAVAKSVGGNGNGRRAELLAICEANECNSLRIAAALGIRRSALFQRLKAHGVSLRELKKSGKSMDGPRTSRILSGDRRWE